MEYHHQRAIKLLLSRLLNASARCGSGALASVLPVHSGQFPSLHWRMHYHAPPGKRVDHALDDCDLPACWQDAGALSPLPQGGRQPLGRPAVHFEAAAAGQQDNSRSEGIGVDWDNRDGIAEEQRSAMGAAQELLLRARGDDDLALKHGVLDTAVAAQDTQPLWTHRQLYHTPVPTEQRVPISPWHDIPVAVSCARCAGMACCTACPFSEHGWNLQHGCGNPQVESHQSGVRNRGAVQPFETGQQERRSALLRPWGHAVQLRVPSANMGRP